MTKFWARPRRMSGPGPVIRTGAGREARRRPVGERSAIAPFARRTRLYVRPARTRRAPTRVAAVKATLRTPACSSTRTTRPGASGSTRVLE